MAVDIQDVVERAVRAALAPVVIDSIVVEQRRDHDDQEALYMTLHIPIGMPRLGGEGYLLALRAASHALLDLGDQRFPYVRFVYAGEESAIESDMSPVVTP